MTMGTMKFLVLGAAAAALIVGATSAGDDLLRRRDLGMKGSKESKSAKPSKSSKSTKSNKHKNPPNILVFIVDDLGWNQVGYHANPENPEIKTPNIDKYATSGIEMDRGYMTPWCGPSRAALQTGRTNVFNANISNDVYAFDDDIGYVGGLVPGTNTLATAFKKYGNHIGKNYTTYFNGKWGIGGTTWTNTPMGMGYDFVRTFWGDSIEACDGYVPIWSVPPKRPGPNNPEFGALMLNTIPGYWDQNPLYPDADWCPYIQNNVSDDLLTPEEKFIACKSTPRTPPKHIDLDLLDTVVTQIHSHDYHKGPMLNVFGTQMMHLPINYPKKYDDESDDVPPYFKSGETKPEASPEDLRLATNNALRFVDDLFGSTMQALKDAGQWDNTIVYFTTDNGGAIYLGSVNNNYPLRSSKFSSFEGGVRVNQFISGGWLEKNLPKKRGTKSDTYVFPVDIAPTLLEMAGGDVSFLLGDSTGAVYGNEMWNYIKNSIDPHKHPSSHQLPRKVSYGADFFFDVKHDRTLKNFYTGRQPQTFPRHWEPIWPKNDSLLLDFGYLSVQPCRTPEGVPLDCCVLDVTEDPREFHPKPARCDKLQRKAQELYTIEGGCEKVNGNFTNPMCLPPGFDVSSVPPEKLSLWSQYGAHGPWTNSEGVPIDGLPMKCACDTIDPRISQNEVDYFTITMLSPTECFNTNVTRGIKNRGVPCEGGFSFLPQGGKLEAFETQGYDREAFEAVVEGEQTDWLALERPQVMKMMLSYMKRENFTEWPNMGRVPFHALSLDSCTKKKITPAPFPVINMAPYVLGSQDPTVPYGNNSGGESYFIPSIYDDEDISFGFGLCQFYTNFEVYCPSHQNPLLEPVKRWEYNDFDREFPPFGVFANGSLWEHLDVTQCDSLCPVAAEGTAYVGNESTLPHGIQV